MTEITLVSQAMPGEIKVPHLGGGPSRGSDCHFEVKECRRLQNISHMQRSSLKIKQSTLKYNYSYLKTGSN